MPPSPSPHVLLSAEDQPPYRHVAPDQRQRIINQWGAALERDPCALAVVDATLLPYGKEDILNAICHQICVDPEPANVVVFETATSHLANYQEGVGPEPLFEYGFDVTALANLPTTEAARIVASSGPRKLAYERFASQIRIDRGIIRSRIESARNLRNTLLACAGSPDPDMGQIRMSEIYARSAASSHRSRQGLWKRVFG